MPRAVHVFLLLVLAAIVGLIVVRGRNVREDRAEVLAALRAASGPRLPAAARAGAVTASAPVPYDRETLYELIDGAAEAYLADGFEACRAANYTFATPAGEVEVAAEAHRFAAPEGAAARLAGERPRGATPVPGLTGAVSDGSVLLALSGRDLLKLTNLSPGATGEPLAALAAAWRQEISP